MNQENLLQEVINFIKDPDQYSNQEALKSHLIENQNSQTNSQYEELSFLVRTNEINDGNVKSMAIDFIARVATIQVVEDLRLKLSIDDLSNIYSYSSINERGEDFKQSVKKIIEEAIEVSSDVAMTFGLAPFSLNESPVSPGNRLQSPIEIILPGEDGPSPEPRAALVNRPLQPLPPIGSDVWRERINARRETGRSNDLIR